jgi:hypothetical protein
MFYGSTAKMNNGCKQPYKDAISQRLAVLRIEQDLATAELKSIQLVNFVDPI